MLLWPEEVIEELIAAAHEAVAQTCQHRFTGGCGH